MADIYNATLAARDESADIPVTALAPLGFNSSKAGVMVYAKNDGGGGSRWGLIYTAPADDDVRILYPTSDTIKVVGGPIASAVLLSDG